MKLRTKVTLLFSFIVGAILLISSGVIYYFSADFREKEYTLRLKTKMQDVKQALFKDPNADSLNTVGFKQNVVRMNKMHVLVLDAQNKTIFNPYTDVDRTYPSSLIKDANLSFNKEAVLSRDNFEVIASPFIGNHKRYTIIISAIDIYGFRKVANLKIVLTAVSAIMLLISFFSGWFISGQALMPITDVINQVSEISVNNLHSRVDEGNGKDEIGQLAKTFNSMLERLEAAFEMQKSFFSNASHELRTPLTTMSGQIEICLLKDRTQQDYREILGSLQEEIRSMTELSNGLLELASASIDISNIRLTELRIDELLWQSRSDLMRGYPGHEVFIEFMNMPDDESCMVVKGNEQLLKTAFMNLMRNGCKFSIEQQVRVTLSFHDKDVEIHVIDNGIGIAKEEMALVLQPFYRASNARHIKGHGLGLSLANRIFSLHGGELDITSEQGVGTDIKISLPTLSV